MNRCSGFEGEKSHTRGIAGLTAHGAALGLGARVGTQQILFLFF